MAKRLLLLGVGLALAASAQAQGQKALGVLFSGDASVRGAVLLRAQATEVLSGSQIAAGEGTALLKLERGGQLRVCPRTNLSLNAGVSGQALSLGLNAGAMELDYSLENGADSLITPDFRLLLISPGSFHLAISVAASGDTCMRSLPGNSASVFVTEMMGNDSFQLAPGKNVLFLKGKIALATQPTEECGCPETTPPPTMEYAQAPSEPAPVAETGAPAGQTPTTQDSAALPATEPSKPGAATTQAATTSQAAATTQAVATAEHPEAAHLEVDSQFSYRGNGETQDFYSTAGRLSVSTDNSKLALALLPQVSRPGEAASDTPPAAAATAKAPEPASAPATPPSSKVSGSERKGGGIGGFFRWLFGRRK